MDTYNLESSWGTLIIDRSGSVLKVENAYIEEENYLLDIDKVDVEEFISHMKSKGWSDYTLDDEDILFFGFWRKDGSYSEPDTGFRREIILNN